MKATPRVLADVLAESRAVVVTSDQRLASDLSQLLTDVNARPPLTVTSYADAERLVAGADVPALFIDLRTRANETSPRGLLGRLASRTAPRSPIIALGDSTYACAWANEADLAIHGRLRLPLHRHELAELLQS